MGIFVDENMCNGCGTADEPMTLYAHFYLGLVYLEREMFEDAQTFFRKTLALGPNLIEAYYELGRALWFNGQRDEAMQAWRDDCRVRGDERQALARQHARAAVLGARAAMLERVRCSHAWRATSLRCFSPRLSRSMKSSASLDALCSPFPSRSNSLHIASGSAPRSAWRSPPTTARASSR